MAQSVSNQSLSGGVLVKQDQSVNYVRQTLSGYQLAIEAMDNLAVSQETENGIEVYYEAAQPGYKSSFTRDSLISMSLRGDTRILLSQLDYSVRRLGDAYNPANGMEPGKAHHELPDVNYRAGLSTAYNATDATAELLRSIAVLAENGYVTIIDRYTEAIDACLDYVRRHLDERGLFTEDPRFSGATEADGRNRHFSLKVTHWKDSELNRQSRTEPHYPIVYSTIHFQYASALQRLGAIMKNSDLVAMGLRMTEAGLRQLWRDDHFVAAIDEDGIIDPPSSDSLMCLLYLEPSQLPEGWPAKIEDYMQQLETAAGYRAGLPTWPGVDDYHMKVWTHEQALLNAAAKKHGLIRAQTITGRIIDHIKPFQSLYPEIVEPEDLMPAGNPRQLWAMATYLYFQEPASSLL